MDVVGGGEVARVLREVGRLGPYFELLVDDVGGGAWRPFSGDVERLRELTRDHAVRLGTGERRVAASLLFQGLAARLWSPVVASSAAGIVPDLRELRWSWAPGEAITLGVPEACGWRVEEVGEAASVIQAVVVDGLLRPLQAAMSEFVRLADGLVWGNAASALAGTLRVPGSPVRVALVRELLGREPLAGALDDRFVRRSCCLYYRVPGGGMCGDCGLLTGS
ncbi:(2Fe-2S)-binding protein [Actinomadura sp. NAK00032]|uniref:(2Fe-2S)-binding protein n=1 Tax=Actinomadura sp. NAK00032 TaxID=2742128 RepID=UPI0015900DCE|nr:(2Fe-2S)-binding protein [Actinomadura sp. NAK00032]QKW34675.1 (2Fe-2S)-binding protein [Actinomadura sp. NAK00032]